MDVLTWKKQEWSSTGSLHGEAHTLENGDGRRLARIVVTSHSRVVSCHVYDPRNDRQVASTVMPTVEAGKVWCESILVVPPPVPDQKVA